MEILRHDTCIAIHLSTILPLVSLRAMFYQQIFDSLEAARAHLLTRPPTKDVTVFIVCFVELSTHYDMSKHDNFQRTGSIIKVYAVEYDNRFVHMHFLSIVGQSMM